MIKEANIGIGLSGNEGNQAVSSSDYALGAFKDLKTLIFYHGREAYRRNAYTICFIFYKNLLQNTTIVFYGLVSGFSGQLFYETVMTQTFNLIYTSWPIIVYATQDQEFEKHVLLDNPQLYVDGMQGLHYNLTVFWNWVFYAFIQSFFLMAAAFALLTCAPAALGSNQGELPDMWIIGAMLYIAIVFIVNNKLLLDANSTNFIVICINVMSNVLVVLAFFAVNFFAGDELYRKFVEFWEYPALLMLLVFFTLSMWPLGTFYHYWFCSTRYQAARFSVEERGKAPGDRALRSHEERDLSEDEGRQVGGDQQASVLAIEEEDAIIDDEAQQLLRADLNKANTFIDIKSFTMGGDHTGFAFAGEEGHVPQITDNLQRQRLLDQDA